MTRRTAWGVLWIVAGLLVSLGGMVLAIAVPPLAWLGATGFAVGIVPFVAGCFLVRHALPEQRPDAGRGVAGSLWDVVG
jgi:hypothetical protein